MKTYAWIQVGGMCDGGGVGGWRNRAAHAKNTGCMWGAWVWVWGCVWGGHVCVGGGEGRRNGGAKWNFVPPNSVRKLWRL